MTTNKVMKSAINDWYLNNMKDWEFKTKRIISRDNISYNMNMYLKNKFPNMNDEYNNSIIAKFGSINPASVSPRMNAIENNRLNESDSEHEEKTFFTVGAQNTEDLTQQSPLKLKNSNK